MGIRNDCGVLPNCMEDNRRFMTTWNISILINHDGDLSHVTTVNDFWVKCCINIRIVEDVGGKRDVISVSIILRDVLHEFM